MLERVATIQAQSCNARHSEFDRQHTALIARGVVPKFMVHRPYRAVLIFRTDLGSGRSATQHANNGTRCSSDYNAHRAGHRDTNGGARGCTG